MVERRAFLQNAGAVLAAAAMMPARALAVDGPQAAPKNAAPVAGKDPRLIVHTAAPVVLETPQALLADAITPVRLLFVRNNQQPADATTIKPANLTGAKIELAGLVDRVASIDAQTLATLVQVEREMVLQCSGNSRALFNASAPVKGTAWGRGGMGNVVFGGVPLADVLAHAGVKIQPQARFLTAEGSDGPAAGEQDFEHSLPLDEALRKSIIALRINGEALPAVHGGPLRLVTPGYYGTMHIKWLTRLRFEERESDHTSHMPRYRTPLLPIKPGTHFENDYANSEPNWRMKIKSVVLEPVPGAKLPPGEATASGVAFNDGEARIDAVLISVDEGATWRPAELKVPESPYAWYRWKARVRLVPGTTRIWARAIDALGRSQPLDGGIHWNEHGYAWNGVEKINVTVG